MKYFLTNENQFLSKKIKLSKCLQLEKTVPDQVFQPGYANFSFEEFDWAMSSDFWLNIKELSRFSGDEFITMAVLKPSPIDYYRNEFGFYNWADLPVSILPDEYWNFLNICPIGSPADSLLYNSERIVWVGQSQKWAIWGDRGLSICVFASRNGELKNDWHDISWATKFVLPAAYSFEFGEERSKELFIHNYGCLPQ